MCFVHLKAYLNITVDFAAHRGAPRHGAVQVHLGPHRTVGFLT